VTISTVPDEKEIVVAALVDRSVAGKMPESEQEHFEVRMLQDAGLAQRVELAHRMRTGLKRLQERGDLPALRTPPSPRWRPMSLAAAVLLAVGAGVYLSRSIEDPAVFAASPAALQPRSAPGSAQIMSYLLARTRLPEEEATIVLPREAGVVQLRILPEATQEAQRLHVELRSAAAGAPALASFEASADAQGMVSVYVDAARVSTGSYVVTLKSAGSAPAEYRFRIASAG
jgi:hypothetical protein